MHILIYVYYIEVFSIKLYYVVHWYKILVRRTNSRTKIT